MRPLAAALALASWPLAWPLAAAAQSFQATLSRDTVPMGEVFELLVRVPVPPGSAVYFPDTLARTEALESHAPVTWQAEATATGGATLTLTYPVIAWGAGGIPVPGFDVFVAPASAPPPGAATIPGGSHVGAWSDAPARGAVYVPPLRVPRRGVWVNPVFSEEQLEVGVEPMPAADVVGGSWHLPSVVLGLLFTGALLALGLRAWGRAAGGEGRALGDVAWTPSTSRRHALEQLDRLLAEKLHSAGRTHELYTRSSGIVRTFVGRIDPALGSDLTSSELVGRLRGRTNGRLGDALFREMGAAEVVKFGRARPGEGEAESHIRSLRAWIADSGEML
jgi:hypothetical protein